MQSIIHTWNTHTGSMSIKESEEPGGLETATSHEKSNPKSSASNEIRELDTTKIRNLTQKTLYNKPTNIQVPIHLSTLEH